MKIVLAYSGGLDTSVLLKQFIEAGHDVVAMTLNLGESDMVAGDGSQAALDAVRKKALDLGAKDAVLVDARERFIEEYAYKALAANARYQGSYPLSAALSRPLIADLLVEIAEQYGYDAVAHGCTGKGNDQVRIEVGRARARTAPENAGAAAGQAAVAPRRDRLRAKAQRADLAHRREAVFGRRQPLGPVDRRRACSKIPGTRRPKMRTRGRSTRPTRRPTAPRSCSRSNAASRR